MNLFQKLALCFASVLTLFMIAAPAQANQCVRNKFGSGISVNVQWYNPADLAYTKSGKTYNISQTNKSSPVFSQNLLVSQLGCTNSNTQYTAVLSVNNGNFAVDVVEILADTVVGTIGAVVCVGSEGTACPAVAAVAGGISQGTIPLAIPSAAGLFKVTTPSTGYAYDVWGSVWNPKGTTGDCVVPALDENAKHCTVDKTIMGNN